MLDIGWPELMVVAVVTLIVVGPKEIPRVLRTVMLWARKARDMAREFQSGIDEMAREADLDDLKRDLERPLEGDLAKELEDAADPTGAVGQIFNDDPLAEMPAPPNVAAEADEPAAGTEEPAAGSEEPGASDRDEPLAEPVEDAKA